MVTIYDVSSADPTKTLRRQLGEKYDVKKVRNKDALDFIEVKSIGKDLGDCHEIIRIGPGCGGGRALDFTPFAWKENVISAPDFRAK